MKESDPSLSKSEGAGGMVYLDYLMDCDVESRGGVNGWKVGQDI